MSNTFIGPGSWKKDELFEEVKRGLLLQGSQYGYVEPAKGQFMFKCDEAYEITKGDIGQRYRAVSLSGVILEVLNKVRAIADDFILTDPGYCGKGGQSARTTDGGPHICITDVVVGGLSQGLMKWLISSTCGGMTPTYPQLLVRRVGVLLFMGGRSF